MGSKPRPWSNLEGQIPEEPKPKTERELAIERRCDELRGLAVNPKTGQPFEKLTMKELALGYGDLEEEAEFEDLAKKTRSVEYEAHERVIRDELQRIQELSGQDTWRGEGHTFSPKNLPVPIITNRAALEAWIEENGHEYLWDIHGGRLKEIVLAALNTDAAINMTPTERAALKPGEPASGVPPPGVSVFLKKSINHRGPARKPTK